MWLFDGNVDMILEETVVADEDIAVEELMLLELMMWLF